MPEAPHLTEITGDYQCLHEFIPAARAKVDSNIWGYLIGATESETTLMRARRITMPLLKFPVSAQILAKFMLGFSSALVRACLRVAL